MNDKLNLLVMLLTSIVFRQITKVRRCWSCPNVAPVTADLSQDHELRRLVRVWEEARDKEIKEIILESNRINNSRKDSTTIFLRDTR